MDYRDVFAKIDALQDEYLKLWIDMSAIESPTKHKPGVDAVGALCIEKAREFGWDVEVHEESIAGNAICITMNPDRPGAPVCLSGHLDTVHPVGSFGQEPVRVEGDKLYGPGVLDCKGGIAASFLAMAALDALGFEGRPVKLIIQADEEVGSSTSEKRNVEFMAKKAEGAVAFLNGEPYNPGKVILFRKGILKYRFDVTGKAVHGSACYKGVSAIAEAAAKILELEKWKDAEGVTCNVGTIIGGTATNTVPDKCSFTVDIRYATDEQSQWAKEKLQEIADTSFIPGSSCELTMESYRCAMEKHQRNYDLLDNLNAIYEKIGLNTLVAGGSNGGADSAEISAHGIPCLCSFGVSGGQIHNPGEYADISSLAECAKRMAAAALYL